MVAGTPDTTCFVSSGYEILRRGYRVALMHAYNTEYHTYDIAPFTLDSYRWLPNCLSGAYSQWSEPADTEVPTQVL